MKSRWLVIIGLFLLILLSINTLAQTNSSETQEIFKEMQENKEEAPRNMLILSLSIIASLILVGVVS